MTQIIPKGFKQTEIGVIPEDWRFKNLDDITNIVTDYVANGSFTSLKENVNYIYDEGYAKLIRLVDYNRGFKGDSVFIDKKGYNFLRKTKLYGGEIIISNVGANCGLIFRVPNLNLKMSLGPNSIMIKTNQNDTFYYYFLISNLGQNLLGNIKSGSAVPKFNKTDLKKLKLPIPPLPQQQKIAQILSSLDDKIELLEKQNKTLENIGQAIFKSWFVDFEGFENNLVESDMGMIPRGWRVEGAENIIKFIRGIEPGSKNYFSSKMNYSIEFIRVADLLGNKINIFVLKDILKNKICNKNDILISFDGTVGRIAFGLEGGYSTGIRKLDSKLLNSGFLYFLFNSQGMQNTILKYSKGTTILHAGESIKFMNIIIPDDDNLEKIQEIFDNLFNKMLGNKLQIQTLSNLRDSLLPRLMNGKVRV